MMVRLSGLVALPRSIWYGKPEALALVALPRSIWYGKPILGRPDSVNDGQTVRLGRFAKINLVREA